MRQWQTAVSPSAKEARIWGLRSGKAGVLLLLPQVGVAGHRVVGPVGRIADLVEYPGVALPEGLLEKAPLGLLDVDRHGSLLSLLAARTARRGSADLGAGRAPSSRSPVNCR